MAQFLVLAPSERTRGKPIRRRGLSCRRHRRHLPRWQNGEWSICRGCLCVL